MGAKPHKSLLVHHNKLILMNKLRRKDRLSLTFGKKAEHGEAGL